MAIYRGDGGAGDADNDVTVTTITKKAQEAKDSATEAANSASAAFTSAENAAISYDNFDDRYLGAKASDPTLDNDGDALITGALYFNTVSNAMQVYNGTAWTALTGTGAAELNDLTTAVTWANVPDANITESSVTQHEAALSITESQISDLGSYITASSTDTLTNKSGNISQWTNDSAYLTGNQTITLSGDATGSGTTAITVTVADDSHNHIISNVDGLQTALDAKGTLSNVVEDTTPQLGGDLDLNSNDITGTGNIDITGNLTATGNLTSTGIDDNATSTAITIDSNERVGIGTNALSYNGLALKGRLEIRTYSDDNSGGWIETTEESGASNGLEINANRGSGKIVFSTNTSERMRIDSSGNVGIGTSSPGFQMDIQGSSNNALRLKTSSPILRLEDSDDNAHHTLIGSSDDLYITSDAGNTGAGNMIFRNGGTTERMRITSSGNVGIGTSSPEVKFHIENGSDNASIVRIEGADSTSEYLGFGVNSGLAVIQAGGIGSTSTGIQFNTSNAGTESEAMRITSSGNVGIGTSNPARELHISDSGTPSIRIQDTGGTNQYAEMLVSGSAIILQARNDTSDGNIVFRGLGGGTATEHMRISSAGNVGIGTTSPSTNLQIKANDNLTTTFPLRITNNAGTGYTDFGAYAIDTLNVDLVLKAGGNTSITIDKDTGYVGIGTTAPFNPLIVVGDAVTPVAINRETNDGQLISFRQDGVQEGSISVSGTTVSYNGGHLSRWGRLPDGSQPTILKGTAMSNLDEMVVWSYDDVLYTEEDELPVDDDGNPTASVGDVKTPAYTAENEQRNQLKVSDVEGDINVAGLFVKWDTEEDGYNDIDLAMTGDMIIRIAQGTTVQRGDLLMSAGDGTAKPQGDDIVRSKTIAKVTSTTVINTYDDGSYVVPCVVMAC